MDWLTMLLALAGLALLVVGAEVLIKGASALAAAVGVSPLVVGLTVVAFGTSAPELAVSLLSAARDQADIAVGNVVGSNIFNVLFILGLSALAAPLEVNQKLLRLDVPLMIASATLVWVLSWDGHIGWLDGSLLSAGIVAYTVFAIRQSRKEGAEIQQEYAQEFSPVPAGGGLRGSRIGQVLLIVGGLAMLVLGSHWLVNGAVMVARALGVSELVIGLTIVAAGTSLPEVATSVMASIRGERDIAVGNVVGSNIFNVLAVLGLSSILSPRGVAVTSSAFAFDIPVMIAVSVACLPIFFSGRIARAEGVLFLGFYAAYTTFLILAAKAHPLASDLKWPALWFAIPLTLITLLVIGAKGLSVRRASGSRRSS
jgi:cation:H+ antiporter